MSKAPAFMFYVKDWLTDSKVIRMSAEQRGYYIDLLCHMWLDGGQIEADEQVIRNLLRCPADLNISPILDCLYKVDGFFRQKRLDEEVEKNLKRRERGISGSAARWQKHKEKEEKKKTRSSGKSSDLRERDREELKDMLVNFHAENPDRYPKEMYADFLEYWGADEQLENPKRCVYKREKSFALKLRLKTWYQKTDHFKKESAKVVATPPRVLQR